MCFPLEWLRKFQMPQVSMGVGKIGQCASTGAGRSPTRVQSADPGIRGTDDGIWRRVRLIPFTVQIPDASRDLHLPDKLATELPGVLQWALEGTRLPPFVVLWHRTARMVRGENRRQGQISAPLKHAPSTLHRGRGKGDACPQKLKASLAVLAVSRYLRAMQDIGGQLRTKTNMVLVFGLSSPFLQP